MNGLQDTVSWRQDALAESGQRFERPLGLSAAEVMPLEGTRFDDEAPRHALLPYVAQVRVSGRHHYLLLDCPDNRGTPLK